VTSASTKMLVISLVVIVVLSVLGLFYVWRHHRVISMGAELGRVHETYLELSNENDKLNAEYETLRRNKNVLKVAEQELKMIPRTSARIIMVAPEEADNHSNTLIQGEESAR
jgi:cell division protein FtsL